MGNHQSTSKKMSPWEMTHGIYNNYKWTPKEICQAVRESKITPLYEGEFDETPKNNIFCETCYLYYPRINQTTCCHHQICSECLAALIEFDTNKRKCPFCRSNSLTVLPNIDKAKIIDHSADEDAFQKIEAQKRAGTYVEDQNPVNTPKELPEITLPENVTQEEVDQLVQITLLPKYEIISLLAAGIEPDAIIAGATQ